MPDAHLAWRGEGPCQRELEQPCRKSSSSDGRVHFLGRRTTSTRFSARSTSPRCPRTTRGRRWSRSSASPTERRWSRPKSAVCPTSIDNGETGVLVPPRRADALAEALVALIEDPGPARLGSRRPRLRRLDEFTIEAAARRFTAAVRAALRSRQPTDHAWTEWRDVPDVLVLCYHAVSPSWTDPSR